MSQTQTFKIGYENGSCGYNNLSYLNITVNNCEVQLAITLEDGTRFNNIITKDTIIETKSDEQEYPFTILTINNEKIHRQKYYYKNISIVIYGDCNVEKKITVHCDR